MIYIIDDDPIMADCIALNCRPYPCRIFTNAISAIQQIDQNPPTLIFLDILLDGPDGFTFLHELASYPDTMKTPIILVSSLSLSGSDFSKYGVVGVLDKTIMTPKEIRSYVERYQN